MYLSANTDAEWLFREMERKGHPHLNLQVPLQILRTPALWSLTHSTWQHLVLSPYCAPTASCSGASLLMPKHGMPCEPGKHSLEVWGVGSPVLWEHIFDPGEVGAGG